MEDSAGIYARESIYLERYVQLGVAGNRVISVSFPREVATDAGTAHPVLDRIERYLDGTRESFEPVELALTIDTADRQVLEAVRSIPYGEQRNVAAIARRTPGLASDEQAAHESVRRALEVNPVPLLIPDHRVRDGPSAAPPDVEQRLRALEGL